ncbi:MAG: hypothetical protein K9N49_06465 [Candidatus Marinimicrobia bacterium]|nr:hypothetical protein [Candidatus Neomarinimicrobiota bacterium]
MLIIDIHSHCYPTYDLGQWVRATHANLARWAPAPAAVLAVVLADGAGQEYFRAWRSGRCALPPGWGMSADDEPESLRLAGPGAQRLLVVAGRQIVTVERLEVLAIGVCDLIANGQSFEGTLEAIRVAAGFPVVPWAPGKWLGKRGRMLRAALRGAAPGGLALGDSALRPRGLPKPPGLLFGQRQGLAVLAGSGPLPGAGEENQSGCYAALGDIELDVEAPAASLRAHLANPALSWRSVGHRNGILTAARRWTTHARRPAPPAAGRPSA